MVKIGNYIISERSPVYIIAEIGVNHNGSVELAKKLIDRAVAAGANAVKFQTFDPDEMVSEDADLAPYQKRCSNKKQKEMLKHLALTPGQLEILKKDCDHKGITWLSTPFDIKSARFLNKLKVPAFKVGSGDLTNIPLLLEIAKFGKPILLSTGMAELTDIETALNYLNHPSDLVLLHCTSAYPAPFADLHLRVIDTLKAAFPHLVGYSDHSSGVEIPLAATALGYKIIEKHFTLDKRMEGPDHRASLEPDEFCQMVTGIRHVEKALGTSHKLIRPSEAELKKRVRKGIYACKDLDKGIMLTEEDLAYLRPLSEIEASQFQCVVGRRLNRSIKKGDSLRWSDLN
ncbi:N-acetylneuraminate synthase [Kroppenstedtia eburnea]|uniref:N-acetylneuraminate synthase n=1 Tax=Kroppenstedtia eburnea TaxID=714067 RepID=A0A1N7Q8R2_9BACL|nr:N-acetylneuraminate synthase [Kroppenstedtia eburnea]EGK12910.1 N-acetylneuraminic acid synthetase [Desmospora sp. 8437]QKI82592.1 N-acetylneuraminate synthase [Kroppenstedtia eburnea]SIT19221.1 N-acetylneuraminate synthase [Kroppenstedtia eburnea]